MRRRHDGKHTWPGTSRDWRACVMPKRRAACPRSGKFLGALALAAVLAVTAGALPPVQAGRSDYVGAQVCGSCHQAAYQSWQASAHARADARLGPSPSPRCLGCHTTGEAPLGRAFFAGVQCEACHGPGAAYATDDVMRSPTLANYLGLRDLSTPALRAALCAECHRAGTRLAPFDPEAAYRRIEHQ